MSTGLRELGFRGQQKTDGLATIAIIMYDRAKVAWQSRRLMKV